MKWCLLVAVTLSAFGATAAHAQGERCGAGQDLVVRALERITPQSDNAAFEAALQLLKHAVSTCPELGDAWYYRSLVEKRLGHDALAKYAMDKARFNGSEAMDQALNPLVLATPASRGFGAVSHPGTGANTTPTTAAQSRPVGPIKDKWALVVGISKFSDRTVPKLNYTTADATAFAAELTDPAIGRFPAAHVRVLTDEQATTKAIKEGLNWIARQAQPDDLVMIYVATHGTPRTADSAGGANYFVTYDTEVTSAQAAGADSASGTSEDALYATAYPMVELANAVATRMKALRTAVILDTCYSGGSLTNQSPLMAAGLANTAPSSAMLDRMSQGTGRIVMAASRVDEESLESRELAHGYFTYFLLQALKAGKGAEPLSKVFDATASQVSAKAAAQGLRQHPVMSKSSADADFALVGAAKP